LNETRLSTEYLKENRINEIFFPEYYTYWNNSIERKGYSGVAILSKIKPQKCTFGLNSQSHDLEGRVITLQFEDFYLVSVYVPNAGEGLKRLQYRVDEWDYHFHKYLIKLKKRKNVIVTGDFNVAHTEMDIYNPLGREKQPGFTIQERGNFQNLIDSGYIDTFRHFYPDKTQFTFWANRANSRISNSGWRLDYFLISDNGNFKERIVNSEILSNYMGSDHCPIKINLK